MKTSPRSFRVRRRRPPAACVVLFFAVLSALVLRSVEPARAETAARPEQGATESSKTSSKTSSKKKSKKKSKKRKRSSRWKWDLDTSLDFAYDSNVFKLKSKLRDRLDQGRPGDRASGRFDDMDSVDDYILAGTVRLEARHRGLGGRPFRITPEVGYEYSSQNVRRSHPTFGLGFKQELRSEGSVKLRLGYILDFFRRNYLADATDRVGSVSSSERVYRDGTYDQASARLSYRRRLWKRAKHQHLPLDLRKLFGEISVVYRNRQYDGPFHNRNRNVLGAGVGLDAELGKRVTVGIGYDFAYILTPGDREVIIRDETDFGVDFNGDLDALDTNIRTFQRVDRTHFDHVAGISIRYRFAKRWSLWARYDFRLQDFQSDERFDVTYKGREDLRHRVRAGIRWRFARRWAAAIEAGFTHEGVNKRRIAADTNEETSYDRFVAIVSVQARLF